MALPDRTRIRRRLALVAALVALALIALAAVVNGSHHARPSNPPPPAPAANAPAPLDLQPPPLPVPPPPLDRADLIAAVQRATSAYAAGEPPPAQNADLVGRPFRIELPFGCAGPLDPAAPKPDAWYSYDQKQHTLRISVRPQDWTKADWMRALAGNGDFEAIEGFWLSRPWTTSEDCPPPTQGVPPPALTPQTLGLAMFFGPKSSRVLQRGSRPYEYVGKAPDGEGPIAPKGYRLLLAGRVAGFEDKDPVRCHADSPSQRPVCIVTVTFDRVSLENPASGETLAEWGGS